MTIYMDRTSIRQIAFKLTQLWVEDQEGSISKEDIMECFSDMLKLALGESVLYDKEKEESE